MKAYSLLLVALIACGSPSSPEVVQVTTPVEVITQELYFEVPPNSIRSVLTANGFTEVVNDHTGGVYDYMLTWRGDHVTYRYNLYCHENGKIRYIRAEVDASRREAMAGCEEFLYTAVKPFPGADKLVPWIAQNWNKSNATTQSDGTKVTVDVAGPVAAYLTIEPV